jgi:peptidoglycan hydrolase CwlO-like protein
MLLLLKQVFSGVFTKVLITLLIGMTGWNVYNQVTTKNLKSQYLQLLSDNGVLVRNVESSVETINSLKDSIEKYEELNNKLQQNLTASNGRVRVLQEKLNKHDLTDLSIKKPTLIEKRMQNATNETFNNFFDFTGPSN